MVRLIGILILIALLSVAGSIGFAAERDPENGRKTTVQARKTKGDAIIATALKYKGVPYKFGGASPKGFDCSGLVWYVYGQHGKSLPRTADKQFDTGKKIAQKELMPGDVVFFTTYEKGASHCGLYIGTGKFIHSSSSKGVAIAALNDQYWKNRYLGARRII